MELKICKHCKEHINKDASICPHCRGKQDNSLLKLIIIAAGLFILYQLIYGVPSFDSYKQKASAKIEPTNMTVKITRFDADRDFITVIGYTENHSNRPAAAKVKISCYDAKSNVVQVANFWPESIRNVPANSRSNFKHMFDSVPGIKRYEYEVISTKTW